MAGTTRDDGFDDAFRALGDDPDPGRLRAFLETHGQALPRLIEALRRPRPGRVLERIGEARSDDARIAGVLVQNPRTPLHVARRLISGLYWHDLALVAANPWVAAGLRQRAEALLLERLHEMRLGDRIELARMAPSNVLRVLLAESDARLLEGALFNPRLQESVLLQCLRSDTARLPLFDAVARSPRWRGNYAARLELALQARTPLPIALAQVTSLNPADLKRLAASRTSHPLVRAAAEQAAAAAQRNPRR